jgi:hypothetical protein
VKLSEQPVDIQQGVSCPLCHETLRSAQQYQRHVGRHQEQLSLFALPSRDGDGEADGHDQDSDESDMGEPIHGLETSDYRLSWMDDQTYPPLEAQSPEKPEEEEDEEGGRRAKEAEEAIATYKAREVERIQKQKRLEELEKSEDAEELPTTNKAWEADQIEEEEELVRLTEKVAEYAEEAIATSTYLRDFNNEVDDIWDSLNQAGFYGRQAEEMLPAIYEYRAAEQERLEKEERRERQQEQENEAEEAIYTDDDLKTEGERHQEKGTEKLAFPHKAREVDQFEKQEELEEDAQEDIATPRPISDYDNWREDDRVIAASNSVGGHFDEMETPADLESEAGQAVAAAIAKDAERIEEEKWEDARGEADPDVMVRERVINAGLNDNEAEEGIDAVIKKERVKRATEDERIQEEIRKRGKEGEELLAMYTTGETQRFEKEKAAEEAIAAYKAKLAERIKKEQREMEAREAESQDRLLDDMFRSGVDKEQASAIVGDEPLKRKKVAEDNEKGKPGKHVNDKHEKTRKFYCTQPGCDYSRQGSKSFLRKDNWKRHMLKRHSIDPQNVTDEDHLGDVANPEKPKQEPKLVTTANGGLKAGKGLIGSGLD